MWIYLEYLELVLAAASARKMSWRLLLLQLEHLLLPLQHTFLLQSAHFEELANLCQGFVRYLLSVQLHQ